MNPKSKKYFPRNLFGTINIYKYKTTLKTNNNETWTVNKPKECRQQPGCNAGHLKHNSYYMLFCLVTSGCREFKKIILKPHARSPRLKFKNEKNENNKFKIVLNHSVLFIIGDGVRKRRRLPRTSNWG